MSPGVMLSSTISSMHGLPKLATDKSNWIIWKTCIQVFLRSKKLMSHISKTSSPPTKPSTLASTADAIAKKTYKEELEKFEEWTLADNVVQNLLLSTIPESLIMQTLEEPTSKGIWDAICLKHEGKTKSSQVEMMRQLHNTHCSDVDDIRVHFMKPP